MAAKSNYNKMAIRKSKKKSALRCKKGIVLMLIRRGATHEEAVELFYESVADYYCEKLVGEPEFKPDKGICSYLSGIALNKWREELRKRKKGRKIKEISTAPDQIPERKNQPEKEDDEQILLMNGCLEELEKIHPIRYEVLINHYYRGLSYKEIGITLFLNKKKLKTVENEDESSKLILKAEDNAKQNGLRGRKFVKQCIESKTSN